MATPSIPCLPACFVLLLVLLPGHDAQIDYTSSTPYNTATRKPNSDNCGNSAFTSPNGTITSPNYPYSYNNFQFCNYFVTTSALSTISFTFNLLSLDISSTCYYDWIEFTCQSNSIRRTVRYCGQGGRYELSFKPCTRVLVRFISDNIGTYFGFSVSYSIETIRCQGNCTPEAVGAGYNCTCDANQTDPFVAPPYNQCPPECGLSSTTLSGYCYCNGYSNTTTQTTTTSTRRPPPTVPTCPEGCYPYEDAFGYPLCYCNATLPSTESTTPITTTPLQCPFGCYIVKDDFDYPVCHCEGTTKSTPCPFGCYNVTYYYGYSYCECSTPAPTTPLTITCPDGCSPDKDFWGTPYCRCTADFETTPTTTSESCLYPCHYEYDDYGSEYCDCTTTTTESCDYPCQYGYDEFLDWRCLCSTATSETTTTLPPPITDCEQSLNDSIGSIASQNYPDNYENDQVCTYSIVAPSLSTISFTFNALDLEQSSDCHYDWIEFTCENNSISRPIRYCGSGYRPVLSFKPCSHVLMTFSSDGSGTGSGFLVSYDIEPISCQGNCTPVANGAGYNCTCDANQTPYIPPPYDQCPDGCDDASTYCACSLPPTDTVTSPSTTRPTNPPFTTTAFHSGCNVTHYDASGILTTPGYPIHYIDTTDCVHNITVQSASSIKLTLVNFNLYCGDEFVQITGCDGSSTAQFCSSWSVNWPMEFICTETYTVTVFFHSSISGYNYGYSGVKLTYQSTFTSYCNSTGGLVSLGSSGNIVSPNYPSSYPLSNDCYYLLQAVEGQMIRIRIAFELLRMQSSPGCSLEYIKFSCLDEGGAPWYVCGARIPSPVTFNCSSVEIQFHSEILLGEGLSPRLFKFVYYGIAGLPPISSTTTGSLTSTTTVSEGGPTSTTVTTSVPESALKSAELSLIIVLLASVAMDASGSGFSILRIF